MADKAAMPAKIEPEQEEDAFLCAICMVQPAGVRLRPCGHNHFCRDCSVQLFSCPFCRVPLLMLDGEAQLAASNSRMPDAATVAAEVQEVVASRTVISKKEGHLVQAIGLGVWLFIFIFGIVEHMHDIRQSCEGGDPAPGNGPEWLTVKGGTKACEKCSPKNKIDCDMCEPGYYNLGTQCFKYLENLPKMKTGAALTGTTYFVLIIVTQVLGLATEVTLIVRLVRRKLMPRKELVILLIAIGIEVSRMFLVDIFVMQEYFGGRAYSIYREPIPCAPNSLRSFQAADSNWYCSDVTLHTANTTYYIASQQEAWSGDSTVCSTFTSASSMLRFDERGLQDIPGHTRFKTMGWVIGGEFALYYFFATFINEVADNMFVVPTTTSGGWLCKLFSIALEVFQLGALCPAAIFTHKECLHYTDPLGVNLSSISTIVIVFGYLIWGFVFLSLPLAILGFAILFCLFLLCSIAAALSPLLRRLANCSCSFRCCKYSCNCSCRCASTALISSADGLLTMRDTMAAWLEKAKVYMGKGFEGFKNTTMMMAFVPMLCGGIFLGTLVVVGQASKHGAMQVLTAIVLLSDVLFKVVATAITEIGDYLLHHRVRRIVASGQNRRGTGEVIGQSLGAQSNGANGNAKGKCEADVAVEDFDDCCRKPDKKACEP